MTAAAGAPGTSPTWDAKDVATFDVPGRAGLSRVTLRATWTAAQPTGADLTFQVASDAGPGTPVGHGASPLALDITAVASPGATLRLYFYPSSGAVAGQSVAFGLHGDYAAITGT